MYDFLLKSFTDFTEVDIQVLILNNVVSFIIAFFLILVYRVTHRGTTISKHFYVSLGMIVIITTLIMSMISNNIALSLGLVGALSIIRFRNAVKNIKDAVFIFWAVAIGITCGISQYIYAAISSVMLFVFMLIANGSRISGLMIIVIRCRAAALKPAEMTMNELMGKEAKQKLKNADSQSCEMIYEVRKSALLKKTKSKHVDLFTTLLNIEGVTSVDQVEKDMDASL